MLQSLGVGLVQLSWRVASGPSAFRTSAGRTFRLILLETSMKVMPTMVRRVSSGLGRG